MKRRLVKGVRARAATGAAGVAALLILIELPRKTDQEANMVVSCRGANSLLPVTRHLFPVADPIDHVCLVVGDEQ